MHIVVVGGGAAGTGAVRTLRAAGAKVTLFDRNAELGGRGRTYFWEGDWRIRGAAAYVGGEPDMKQLATDLGLTSAADIVRVPEEALFETMHPRHGLVPISLAPSAMIRSKILPWREKIRLLAAAPKIMQAGRRAREEDPTSLLDADHITACGYLRRFSPSLVDYIVEPIIQQYFGYSADDYSLGWLLWTMGAPYLSSELPWRFRERGVGRVFHEAECRMNADAGCTLHFGTRVTRILRGPHAAEILAQDQNGKPFSLTADAVVLAVPGSFVSGLLDDLDARRRGFFDQVEYVSHHVMHFLVDKPTVDMPKSVLLPTAMGFDKVSNVWTHRHDDTRLRIHAEVKGAFGALSRSWADDAILDAAWQEIGLALPPLSTARVANRVLLRNDIGLCRRQVGYTKALAGFLSLPPMPRIAFAGDYLANSTLGRSYRTGVQAATALLQGEEMRTIPSPSP